MLRLALFVAIAAVGWFALNPRESESLTFSPAAQRWRAEGKFFQFRSDIKIFYRDDTSSDKDATDGTLFTIHGFPTSSYDFVKVLPFLRKRFSRIISYDMIGFGFSDKPESFNYTIHAQADLAEALLRHLGIENYHLLSHDFGDSVAQELIARRQESNTESTISSWLILNGGVFPELHRPRILQKLLLNAWTGPIVQKFITFSTFKKSFGEIFGPGSQPTEEEFRDFYSMILNNGGNNINYKLIHYITDRERHGSRWVTALLETKIPTLFMNGPFDPVSGQHMLDMFRQRAPERHRAIALAAQVGHYPQLEAPMEVISGYFPFLDSLKGESSQ